MTYHPAKFATLVSWIAGIVALVVALILPLGYYVVALRGLVAELDTEADVRAGMISQYVGSNPDLWRFDRHHLEELLARDPPLKAGQRNRLLDKDGRLVSEMGSAAMSPEITRGAQVFDAGLPVGQVEIVHSQRKILWSTAIAAVLGLLLAAAVFMVLRVLPLRALDYALAALAEEVRQHAEARREAEAASRAKSQFLAAASHDLRQPMHALGLYAAVLEEKVKQPEVRELVQKIRASSDALETLFNELLDISRLDAGVLQANPSEFPIGALLERLRAEFDEQARAKGLRLRIRESRALVVSDQMFLGRILTNLISNAIRYTSSGTVLVGCRKRGQRLRVEVWDTGVGISSEQLPQVFEEFYQVGNPERDRTKGLGLGLAIVRRLAKLLGHKIEAASIPGKGSCFSVELPYLKDVESVVVNAMPRTGSLVRFGFHGRTLVVIDDEAAVRDGMEALLRQWGCEVVAADSLTDTLNQLARRKLRPDGIIADYRLRDGATGLDAIRQLQHEFGASLPAVVVTGDIAAEHLTEFIASGYRHLHKPVPPVKLQEVVMAMFASR